MCRLEDPVIMDLFTCFIVILMTGQSLRSEGLKIRFSSALLLCYVDTRDMI